MSRAFFTHADELRMKRLLENWLLGVAAGHVVLGLLMPFIAYSSVFDFYAAQLAVTFWDGGPVPPQAESFQRWIVALFGPTVAAWGVLMVFLIRHGARTQEKWPWDALLVSVVVWAPADIAISLVHDFWPHVVIDVIAIVIIVVPVLILRTRKVSLA
jgi:hypothetical protein